MIVQMAGVVHECRWTSAARGVIDRAAQAAYPAEACGWLLGPEGEDITDAVPALNEEADARQGARYLMTPASYRAVDAAASRRGLQVVGVFHSHPDHPALPSATDLAEAWPSWVYVIVPVAGGVAGAARAWRLRDDRRAFDPVVVSEWAGPA